MHTYRSWLQSWCLLFRFALRNDVLIWNRMEHTFSSYDIFVSIYLLFSEYQVSLWFFSSSSSFSFSPVTTIRDAKTTEFRNEWRFSQDETSFCFVFIVWNAKTRATHKTTRNNGNGETITYAHTAVFHNRILFMSILLERSKINQIKNHDNHHFMNTLCIQM